jgi:sulfur carrier protein
MKVVVNGRDHDLAEGATLADLFDELDLAQDESRIVAEVNGRIVEPGQLAGQRLEHGDRIELVRFVGGG